MLNQFQSLFDPSATLGAFLISMISGILVSFIAGFFSGKAYIKKKNMVKMKDNSGVINIDSNFNGGVNEKQ